MELKIVVTQVTDINMEIKTVVLEMAPSSSSESTSEGVVASGTAQTECAVDHPLKPNEPCKL